MAFPGATRFVNFRSLDPHSQKLASSRPGSPPLLHRPGEAQIRAKPRGRSLLRGKASCDNAPIGSGRGSRHDAFARSRAIAQDDEIIGISHKRMSSLLKFPVQLVELNNAEGLEAFWTGANATCPAGVRGRAEPPNQYWPITDSGDHLAALLGLYPRSICWAGSYRP